MAWVKLQARAPSRPPRRSATSAAARSPHYKIPRYVKFVDELPDDRDRQDPEVQDARAGDRRSWAWPGPPRSRPREWPGGLFGRCAIRPGQASGEATVSGRSRRLTTSCQRQPGAAVSGRRQLESLARVVIPERGVGSASAPDETRTLRSPGLPQDDVLGSVIVSEAKDSRLPRTCRGILRCRRGSPVTCVDLSS